MYLLDVNLWLALTFQKHVHHSAAKTWFDQAPDSSCSFCRLTQQGLLRLATNPKAFGSDAVPMVDAWRMYDLFLSDARVQFADEPPGLESHWRIHTQTQLFSNKVWSDAYLAAFSQAAGFERITFDRGFSQYQGLKHTIL
ncbi:MAG: TA system VapC family ribonuclease toxin [Pirellulaceae bacterium]